MGLSATLLGLLAVAVLYAVYGAVYRLYLAPVAKFPGPKLAALTFLYEFYFDVIRGGSYVYEIERMHKQYGPIVRINPYELHVRDNDLDFINRLYPSVGREVDKFWWSARMFGNVDMAFGTIPHGVHRMRRNAFGKFFSATYVRRLEPTIQVLVQSMCDKIEADLYAGKKVNLVHAFSALTQDVITEYCFAERRGVLDMDDFAPQFYEDMQMQCSLTPVIKQVPWIIPILNTLPDSFVRVTNSMAWALREQERRYIEQTQRVIDGGDADTAAHATIFHELRDDPDLPASEKMRDRLVVEAASIVGAGTLTTAPMLSLTLFFLLREPSLGSRLRKELADATPAGEKIPDLAILEKLPYLNAIVNEGLRLSYGVMHRLTRVHPKNTLQYRDWVIPPNTPVGMSPYFLHMDPTIFPEPRKFDPERWLDSDMNPNDSLTKYLCGFGKGSRQCVGMRLAYAEIHLAIACVMCHLGEKVKLFDTEYERDVEHLRDYFIPAPSSESRGVRVVLA